MHAQIFIITAQRSQQPRAIEERINKTQCFVAGLGDGSMLKSINPSSHIRPVPDHGHSSSRGPNTLSQGTLNSHTDPPTYTNNFKLYK